VNIDWSARAIADLKAVRDFVARENPEAAQETALKIISSIDILSMFPAAGQNGRVVGTRELVIAGTPYVIPYRLREGRIEVLRVIHSARKWPTTF
jgi:toxin ParE1/3/4